MKPISALIVSFAILLATGIPARAQIRVVASIKPIHSLVAAIMQGVGEPVLIVGTNASPHTYSLKPSHARALEDAGVVFWIGPVLEAFLEKPLRILADRARVVELAQSKGLTRLALRKSAALDGRQSYDSGHGDDHDPAHSVTPENSVDEHGKHSHQTFDPHVWLDPANARAMGREIEKTLSELDPENAERYRLNAGELDARLDALTREIGSLLAPVGDRPFIVFHDAFAYFEHRFALSAAGSLTVSPEITPGAERISNIRAMVKELGATCVFSEPQFKPGLVLLVTEGTGARSAVLDPLGAAIQKGPNLYFELMRNIATAFHDCLAVSD